MSHADEHAVVPVCPLIRPSASGTSGPIFAVLDSSDLYYIIQGKEHLVAVPKADWRVIEQPQFEEVTQQCYVEMTGESILMQHQGKLTRIAKMQAVAVGYYRFAVGDGSVKIERVKEEEG